MAWSVLEENEGEAMKTYYVYGAAEMRFLGRVEAVDGETARMLAEELWDGELCVLDHRHQPGRRIAA